MQSISRIASCFACTAPTIFVSAVALSNTLVIGWWLRLVNVRTYNSISNVHDTMSSTLFGHHCLTANATSGLSSSFRYRSKESCSFALSSRSGNALSATLPVLPNFAWTVFPCLKLAMYTLRRLSGSKRFQRAALAVLYCALSSLLTRLHALCAFSINCTSNHSKYMFSSQSFTLAMLSK